MCIIPCFAVSLQQIVTNVTEAMTNIILKKLTADDIIISGCDMVLPDYGVPEGYKVRK